jgi:carboxyl-terminal processing protease
MKRSSRLNHWKAWLFSAVLVTTLAAPVTAAAAESTPVEQLNEVFSLIEQKHFSGTAAEELKDAAIAGMLRQLNDKYTVYYNDETWTELQNAFEQTYVGIGIQFVFTAEGMRIIQVYAGSAAETAGLKAGDVIVGVAGKAIGDYTSSGLEEQLLGPENSSVKLEVKSGTSGAKTSVTILRRPFHIPTVEAARMDGDIGYIRITSFSSDTADLVERALRTFRQGTPVQSLIVDVRGNPGGYLDAAEDVTKQFIESGVLLHTVNRSGIRTPIHLKNGSSVGVPVTLLVDGHSASASEVFAGALQDYGIAKLIGTRTYGKGSVQQLISLAAGGGLRITIEHYLTPDEYTVNGVGITPERVVARPLDQTFAAVRAAGAKQLRLDLTEHDVVVNGVAFDHYVAVERVNGRVHVPSLALAAALDGTAVWDGDARSVTLKGPNGTAVFDAASGLLLKDGSSYIDTAAFEKAFKNAKVKTTSTTVSLELN